MKFNLFNFKRNEFNFWFLFTLELKLLSLSPWIEFDQLVFVVLDKFVDASIIFKIETIRERERELPFKENKFAKTFF